MVFRILVPTSFRCVSIGVSTVWGYLVYFMLYNCKYTIIITDKKKITVFYSLDNELNINTITEKEVTR